ncbi:hypothetical protein SAMN05421858_1977 [Haladaptatus litoreus]|uniref:Uncharacterized protein n=2 Tax=Haladaptataceae TaxID=3064797 RepID=A0A1N6ZCL3_9EURY|nr:hypothetical protein SAMN05421858_1977 [Haladaptatus litoreus]
MCLIDLMSAEKSHEGVASNCPTCPWCAERIDQQTDDVRISSPGRCPPSHTWHLHVDCAGQWRDFVSNLRTLAGRGAFGTLVEGPLSGDVNEMVEWNDS